MEHFVTLFDIGFLPQGMALHASLLAQGEPFQLWVVCMDEPVEQALEKLGLEHLTVIPVRDVEARHPRLLDVKPGRGRGEYCWTMTSFSVEHVLHLRPDAVRVTYVDADVCLFGPASRILGEMDASGAHVLITDHAFAPEYEQTGVAGRFCVQFVPFRNSPRGREILAWWQDRCIEWCFARVEDGKFGDQMYLDQWPLLWKDDVAILKDVALTLAPWNVEFLLPRGAARGIYHFHTLRLFDGWAVNQWHSYRIGRRIGTSIYRPYLASLHRAKETLAQLGIEVPLPKAKSGFKVRYDRFWKVLKHIEGWARI